LRKHGVPASRAVSGPVRVFLLTVFFAASLQAAGRVVVIKDGSLVFEQPSEKAAVLDILPRGSLLDLAGRQNGWSEVILVNPARHGFIRDEAVTPAPKVPGQTLPQPGIPSRSAVPAQPEVQPKTTVAQSPRTAPLGAFPQLQSQLDSAEARIRQLDRMLGRLEEMSLTLKEIGPGSAEQAAGSGGEQKTETSPTSSRFGIGLFSSVLIDQSDLLAGGSVLWSPGFLCGAGLELDGGYVFVKRPAEEEQLSLNLILPLAVADCAIRPYLCAGAGGVRRKNGVGGQKAKENFSADLGAGAFLPLAGRVKLRADARALMEFRPGDRRTEGRFSLGLFMAL
jgi:hypothetical protein